jgi:hypothetical protein
MVPKGLVNVAFRKRATSSDKDPIIGDLERVTDGDKEMGSESSVELGPGLQYVQVDLGERHEIYAVVFWFNYHCSRIFHDVVVQVADDCDFITNVKTLFNNDYDNSSGLGVGPDLEYYDTYEGKLLGAKGVVARYVRIYSKGSTVDDFNRFTEIEVYARPAKWFQ